MFTNITEAHSFIAELDLSKVAYRVGIVEGMSPGSVIQAEAAYRQFLLIAWKREFNFRGGVAKLPIVPGTLADEMWHAHILHTQDYHDMCGKLLGEYLHHSPDPKRKTSSNPANIENTIRLDEEIPSECRFIDEPIIKHAKMAHSGCMTAGPCNSCGD